MPLSRRETLTEYLLGKLITEGCHYNGYHLECDERLGEMVEDSESEQTLKSQTFINAVIAITPARDGGTRRVNKSPTSIPAHFAFPSDANPQPIESLIRCECPEHKHCLTCRFDDDTWNSGIERFNRACLTDNTKATWWIYCLQAIERATRTWVGEFVAQSGGWDAINLSLESKEVILELMRLSHDLYKLVGYKSRGMFRYIRRILEPAYACQATANPDLWPEEVNKKLTGGKAMTPEEFQSKATDVGKRLRKFVDMLSNAQETILDLPYRLKSTERRIRACGGQHWPAHADRKLRVIYEALGNAYAQLEGMGREVKHLQRLWSRDLKVEEHHKLKVWFVPLAPTIEKLEDWHEEMQKGADKHAAYVFEDRKCVWCQGH